MLLAIDVGNTETKLGVFDFGINASTRADSRGKSNPFSDGGANYQKTEAYITYALPFLSTVIPLAWSRPLPPR